MKTRWHWLSILLFVCMSLAGSSCIRHSEAVEQPSLPKLDTVVEPEVLPLIRAMRANIGYPPMDSINAWLAFVGLPPGNPYCAAAQSAWLHQAGVREPLLRTGLAMNYYFKTDKRRHISARYVLDGVITVPEGSLVVWNRVGTRFGHIGVNTEKWSGRSGVYISGNTSPPGGAERTGGGVFEKPAHINMEASMRIRVYVRVKH